MYGIIKEISTVEGTPLIYVLIHIYTSEGSYNTGKDPIGDNDFLMDLYPTGERIVQNSQGWYKRLDGTFINPVLIVGDEEWERETFNNDLATQIQDNVGNYLGRRDKVKNRKGKFPSNHSSHIKTSQDDPRGILVKSEVQDLVGIGVEQR